MRVLLSFVVPGVPVPKGRARFAPGQRPYTPIRTQRYEIKVAVAARAAGARPVEGPLELELRIYLPDIRTRDDDNVEKAVRDALNGVAYHDDKQIKGVRRRVLVDRASPRVELVLVAGDEDLVRTWGAEYGRPKPKKDKEATKKRAPRSTSQGRLFERLLPASYPMKHGRRGP